MQVYLATGWDNAYAKDIKLAIIRSGHTPYHFLDSGFELDYDKVSNGLRASSPQRQSMFTQDNLIAVAAGINRDELVASKLFVLCEPTGKGSQMEYGMATAFGIPTVLYVTPEYEIGVMDFWYSFVVRSMAGLEAVLEQM